MSTPKYKLQAITELSLGDVYFDFESVKKVEDPGCISPGAEQFDLAVKCESELVAKKLMESYQKAVVFVGNKKLPLMTKDLPELNEELSKCIRTVQVARIFFSKSDNFKCKEVLPGRYNLDDLLKDMENNIELLTKLGIKEEDFLFERLRSFSGMAAVSFESNLVDQKEWERAPYGLPIYGGIDKKVLQGLVVYQSRSSKGSLVNLGEIY